MTITQPDIVDDIDDVNRHALTCACDECIDALVDELEQDRVA